MTVGIQPVDRFAEFLNTTELFAGVAINTLERVLPGMMEVDFPQGSTVFRKGDAGDAVYLIVTGKVRLEVDGVHLVTRGSGECVGEFALIDEGTRSASAVTETALNALRWDRVEFQKALLTNPDVARGLFRILTKKLREDIAIHVNFALEKERYRQDLQRAREIQMGMLPDGELETETVEVSGMCRPAVEVGGDYYDYLEMDDSRLGLIIGDVTGHGFYSGLFVAMAKSSLHTSGKMDGDPREVMQAMRNTLSLSIQRRLLMSCCYVVLDPREKRLSYANAGHPYPYLYRHGTGQLERLEPLDPLLGVLEPDATRYACAERAWLPGDVLVMYTDGVTEERSTEGRMFDHERLEALIVSHAENSAGELKRAILTAVSQHAAHMTQSDDITLVVAKHTGRGR